MKKLLLLGLMIILCSFTASAINSSYIMGWWEVNDNSTIQVDSNNGEFNLTYSGTQRFDNAGPMFTNDLGSVMSVENAGTNNYANSGLTMAKGVICMCAWFNASHNNANSERILHRQANAPYFVWRSQKLRVQWNYGGLSNVDSSMNLAGAPNHGCVEVNTSQNRMSIWINGTIDTNTTAGGGATGSLEFSISDDGHNLDTFSGQVSQTVVLNVSCDGPAQELYNSGAGCTYAQCTGGGGGGGPDTSNEGSISVESTDTIFETDFTDFYINFTGWNTTSDADNLSVWLHWNGTVYNTTRSSIFNGTRFNVTAWAPLVETNGTIVEWWIEYTIRYANGTNETQVSNVNDGNTTLKWAYYLDTIGGPTEFLETDRLFFNYTIERDANRSNISAFGDFNGTSLTIQLESNLTNANFSYFVGLQDTNNTEYTINLNVSVQSGVYNYTRNITKNINIIWAYYINNLDYEHPIDENEDFNLTATYTLDLDKANITATRYEYNGSKANLTATPSNTSRRVLLSSPQIDSGNSASLDILANITLQYGGKTVTRSINATQLVTAVILSSCTENTDNTTLTFRLKQEINLTDQVGTVDTTITYWTQNKSRSKNVSFSFSGAHNYSICIYPNDASFRADSIQSHTATGFSTKEYHLMNASLNATTSFVDLYLLDSSVSENTVVNVLDENGDPISNAIVVVERYYEGEGVFRNVERSLTDSNGNALIKTQDEVFYTLVFQRAETEIGRTVNSKILVNSLFFTFNLVTSFLETESNMRSVTRDLSYNNVSGNVTWTWSDSTGVVREGCLKIIEFNGYGKQVITDQCTQSASSTITYPLGNNLTKIHSVQGFIKGSDMTSYAVLEQINVGKDLTFENYGDLGLFYGMGMVLTVSALGMWNTAVAIALGLTALFFGISIGFFSLGEGAFIVVLLFGVFMAIRSRS